MTKGEIEFLLEVYPVYMDRTPEGMALTVQYEAERILKGNKEINKRGCSCEYDGMKQQVKELYTKWLLENEKKI